MNKILQPHENKEKNGHKAPFPFFPKANKGAVKKIASPKNKLTVTSQNKCELCTASKCCRYVTQQIDAPRTLRDFDTLLWEVSHRNVEIFKDKDGWFLMFLDSPCMHLQTDGGCGIYLERPQICRDHSNENCEFDQPAEAGFDLHFPGYDALQKYCRKRFKKWDQRFQKFAKEDET